MSNARFLSKIPGLVEGLNTAEDVANTNVPPRLSHIRTTGREFPGDGQAGLYIDEDNGASDTIVSAEGRTWFLAPDVGRGRLPIHFERSIPLNLAEEGVVFADDEDSAVDQTLNVRRAIRKAINMKREITSPGGVIKVDETLRFREVNLHFVGNPVNETVFVGTQRLADAGDTILYVGVSSPPIGPGVMHLTENVSPNQDRITLSGADDLRPGMIIQWASDEDWPHDGRGNWMRGEVHRITRDLGGGVFEIDGSTWDFYDVSTQTITVRAWWPGQVTLANLALVMPPPSTAISNVGAALTRMINPTIDGFRAEGMTSTGLALRQNWRGDYRNLRFNRIGREGAVGYGIYTQGEVGSRIAGLEGRACRRVVDLSSLSGTESAPTRLVTVRDFLCDGAGEEPLGDSFYPHGSVPNYGVGTHGPAERCKFINGQITNVRDGVTLRGRDLEVRDVTFRGKLEKCIQGSYGTGLVVDNCVYDKNDHPRKQEGDDQAAVFLQFGGDTNFGPWDYTKASVIQNCVVNGLSDAFIRFAHTRDVQNLTVQGNTVQLRPESGTTGYMFDSPNGPMDIRSATLGHNTFKRLVGNGTVATYHPDITIGRRQSLDDGVDLGDGRFMFTMPDDTAVRLLGVAIGGRVNVNLRSDVGGVRGIFQVVGGAFNLVDLGHIGPSVGGTSSGSLNGTTGPDGQFTFSVNNNDLYFENRTGAERQVVIQVT